MVKKQSHKAVGEAAQQYFGYGLQLNRLLLILLDKADFGDIAWLEVYEDVGITRADGSHFMEQDTTSQTSNPLTDGAEKLWKTLSNWVEAVNNGWIDPERTEFKLYVLQKYKPGTLAQSINDAKTKEDAIACLDAIEQKHWGKPPKNVKKGKISEKLKAHIDRILSNKHVSAVVIQRILVECGDGDPLTETVKILANLPLPKMGPNRRLNFLLHLLGWLKKQTDGNLADGKLAKVSKKEFFEEQERYLTEHLVHNFLTSVASKPTDATVQAEIQQSPNFIRQLELIKFQSNDLLDAANVYLRSKDEFNLWCQDGEATEEQMEDYTDTLTRYWRNRKSGISASTPVVEFGRRLSSECFTQNFLFANQGVPSYFTQGVYHDLANQPLEHLVIGWHPNFKTLLKQG